MKNQTGTLPVGVEFAGGLHRDYELRPQYMEDEVETCDDPKHGARAVKNSAFFAVCIFARRLVKLGNIPKESLTPDLIMRMQSRDMLELQAADRRFLLPEQTGEQKAD
jgi:hypothetical protein